MSEKKRKEQTAKMDEPNRTEQCRKRKRIDPPVSPVVEKGKLLFKVPPEAPVFEPTAEEFANPLKYIAKISKVAEKHGMCKIRPPSNWRSPFRVDVDNFKFTPSIQKLNELDGSTRVKLFFMEKIKNYWYLQGVDFKPPVLEKRLVDLYSLYRIVELEGGFTQVCSARKWSQIVSRLGYKQKKSGTTLKRHYEKWLKPIGVSYVNTGTRRVQPDNRVYNCQKCGKSESEAQVFTCNGCDMSFHGKCLIVPLTVVPRGEWKCHKCVFDEEIDPSDVFGFELTESECSLRQFGEMADRFKNKYFSSEHGVPTDRVEQEYWKIVSSLDSEVITEYGSDLNTMTAPRHGLGFPAGLVLSKNEDNVFYKSYAEDPWSLGNVRTSKESVLSFLNADIPGMKTPWMYVGMCFSTFCWRNDDHWSYSINYLHFGEPKTWYAVPGCGAEAFEKVFRETAPELFHHQPRVLDQLTTVLDPNALMRANVPVCRTDQRSGEFVVTFPRSYHGGFDQGYNFSESVNFAPVDWIPMGRQCANHYASIKRKCVFSLDEIVCNMAARSDDLTPEAAKFVFDELYATTKMEIDQRKSLLDWGVLETECIEFGYRADDQRQCAVCNTTLYISAVSCSCDPTRLACIRHFKRLCHCPGRRHAFKYRYTLDELASFVHKVKTRADLSPRD